jgi:hypothetical protein
MIKPTSLLKVLNYLIGQQYDIDYVNLSPTAMRAAIALFRRIKIYEIKFFETYVIVYIQAKPITIKSDGWTTKRSQEVYIDTMTNTIYHDTIIKFKPNEHSSIRR